jgi:type I restriction enzyme S subunit
MNGFKESTIGLIPNDWSITTIGEISKKVTDGAHASPKAVLNGRYMASVKDMTYNKFDFSDCKEISEDDFQKLVRQGCSPDKGDLLISKDGEKCLDLIFVYDQNEQIVLLSSIAIVKLSEDQDPFFYRYFLLSRNAQYIMNKWFRSGSAIPRVVLKDFKKVPVPKITIEEQLSISTVLRQLDNKITLLKEQNETLEELAQTLFKRWFVEFEFPIGEERAAAMGKPELEGKPYKSSGGKMIVSELGEIPDGWRVSTVGEDFQVTMGQSPPGASYNEFSGTVFYQGRTDFGFRFPTNRLFTTSPKRMAQKWDTLLSVRAPVGDINMANEECCVGRGVAAIKAEFKSYCYYTIKSLRAKFIVFENEGTVFGALSKSDLNEIEIIKPVVEIKKEFDRVAHVCDDKIFSNSIEIQSLTQLRDTLLPKLMSGELRVEN